MASTSSISQQQQQQQQQHERPQHVNDSDHRNDEPQVWDYQFSRTGLSVEQRRRHDHDDEEFASMTTIILNNRAPSALERLFRDCQSMILRDPAHPALTTLRLCCPEHQPPPQVYDVLRQLLQLVGPRLERFVWDDFDVAGTAAHAKLWTILLDDCLVPGRCPRLRHLNIHAYLDPFAAFHLGALLRTVPLQTLVLDRCMVGTGAPLFFSTLRRTLSAIQQQQEEASSSSASGSSSVGHLSKLSLQFSLEEKSETSATLVELWKFCGLFPNLESLTLLPYHDFGDPGHAPLVELTKCLSAVPKLAQLQISYLHLFRGCKSAMADAFFVALARLEHLRELVLVEARLPSRVLGALTQFATTSQGGKLRTLDLTGSAGLFENVERSAATQFLDAVAHSQTARHLQISLSPQSVLTLPLILERLTQPRKSPQSAAHALEGLTVSHHCFCKIEEAWVDYIPKLGSHWKILNFHLPWNKDPKVPLLVSALKQNVYLTSGWFSYTHQDIPIIYERNKLLNKIRSHGRLTGMAQSSHWAVVLEGMANHKRAFDHTPLYLFLQHNVEGIIS